MNNPQPTPPRRRLLVIGDHVGLTSGFACVVRNIVRRVTPWFGGPQNVELWGIGHAGWPLPPHSEWHPYTIYPGEYPWNTPAHLTDMIAVLRGAHARREPFTHIWILQDSWQFNAGDFPEALRKIADETGGRIFFYFPVDAPMDPDWTRMITSAHQPVAYTPYGKEEAERAINARAMRMYAAAALAEASQDPAYITHKNDTSAIPRLKIGILPHGVDTNVFHPLPDRQKIRKTLYDDWADGRTVLLNVNSHQRRKGIVQSFEVLRELQQLGVPCRLHLHMPATNADEGSRLEPIAEQVGVRRDDWTDSDSVFRGGASAHSKMNEAELNRLYNAADVVLSTSLGEGWGLSVTEGLAAGCPVVAPDHTSIRDIAMELRTRYGMDSLWLLPVSQCGQVATHDNCRVRYPVDAAKAAQVIAERLKAGLQFPLGPRSHGLTESAREWLDWDRIAREWIKLFEAHTA